MIWFLLILVIIIGFEMWCLFSGKEEPKVTYTNYLFKYYIKGDPKVMPVEFLVNWKLSELENHLYILEKTLEEDIYGYLEYVWQGYYGKEIYIDVYEKNVIKGSGPYYDTMIYYLDLK